MLRRNKQLLKQLLIHQADIVPICRGIEPVRILLLQVLKYADDADAVSYAELKAICEAVQIPVVAIGGITADNISKLAGSGISGAAVISAIFAAEDIQKAAKELKSAVGEVVKGE
jgi:imidazole glycerol phosphate synthase subunit HisF